MSLTTKQREALQEQGDSIEVYNLVFGGRYYFFTSYFRDINLNEVLYKAIPVQRDGISYSSDLTDITVGLSLAVNTEIGELFKGGSHPDVCTLEIRKYFLVDTSVYDVVISGYIRNVTIDGGILKMVCDSWFSIMGNDFPRLRFQARCNNQLFDSFCALLSDDWKLTATVTAVNGNDVSISYSSIPASYTSIYRNWSAAGSELVLTTAPINGFFINGRLAKVGATANRIIIAHTVGIVDVIKLHFPISNLSIGDSVNLWPGCSKSFDSNGLSCPNHCKSFRDDASVKDFYLGMPQIPYKNPTITPMSSP